MATRTTPTEGSRALEVGVAAQAMPGQRVSGDRHVVRDYEGGVLVAVVDGLGHGDEAADAARRAVDALERHAGESVIALVRHCHTALVGSRGVVMSLASFSLADDTMTWLAIGNVEGRLFRADPTGAGSADAIVLRGGVVGYELPPLRAAMLSVARGDLLVLATDGIRPDFADRVIVTDAPQRIADRILGSCRSGTDDALVVAVRFRGGGIAT